jgi:hypothetical protein
MPVFGEYHTEDKPLFMSGRHGQVRTYWLANRPGMDDDRYYFIKSIALPAPGSTQEANVQGRPIEDLAADFLASVARLKAAYRADPELMAPIHAAGRTDTELWYATDYYPRQSLADFESSAAEINHATLEHVVYSVACACLALQRSTGRSHGNLKAANVLLTGERGPLRQTPLRVIDVAGLALPAVPEELQDPGETDETIRNAMEASDLRGIGGIILELVESNPIEGPDDYRLPIAPSTLWNVLGKHSQRWLDLCNRLLDPDLSLEEINLQSLAKEFKTRPRRGRTAARVAVSLVLVCGIASYLLWNQPVKELTRTWARDAGRVLGAASGAPAGSSTGQSGSSDISEQREPNPTVFEPNPVAPSPPPVLAQESSSRAESRNTEPTEELANSVSQSVEPSARPGSVHGETTVSEPPEPDPPREAASANTEPDHSTATMIPSTRETNDLHAQNTASASQPASADFQPVEPSAAPEPANGETKVVEPRENESTSQTASVNLNPVESATAPASSNEEQGSLVRNTRAPTQTANANNSQQVQSPARRVPSQESINRQARDAEATRRTTRAITNAVAPGARAASNRQSVASQRRDTRSMGQTVISRPKPAQSAAPPVRSATPAPVTAAKLDEQLRQLEAEASRVVALRRNSELFARVDLLEAQYARANLLTGKTKRRLDLLRATMAKKVPGASQQRTITGPLLGPGDGR